MGGAPEDGGRPFQLGDHVRYLGEGWLGSQMRQLLTRKTLVVKSIQHTPTEGTWVTCHVPGGLDQTVPASDLKHFYMADQQKKKVPNECAAPTEHRK
jgi:hypothetical protein